MKIPRELDFANYMVVVSAVSYRHMKAMAAEIKWIVSDSLTFKVPKLKVVELANSVDPDEVAHYEPPHLIFTFCSLVCESSIYVYDLAWM